MAYLTSNLFTVARTPCGQPVYEVDMSEWEGNGWPDPLTGLPCDTDTMRFERKPETGEVHYWVTVSNVSGAFLRIYND